jgi:hypothetical protein
MQVNQKKPVSEILESYAQCSKFDPNRADHLIPLIRHHQATKNWPVAYMISKYAFETYDNKNPFPKSSLFIDKMPYEWGFADLHSVSSYYMQKPAEAKKAYSRVKRALNAGIVPPEHTQRLLKNEEWFGKMKLPAQPVRKSNHQKPKKKRKKRR